MKSLNRGSQGVFGYINFYVKVNIKIKIHSGLFIPVPILKTEVLQDKNAAMFSLGLIVTFRTVGLQTPFIAQMLIIALNFFRASIQLFFPKHRFTKCQ